jgi:hypothetical protein
MLIPHIESEELETQIVSMHKQYRCYIQGENSRSIHNN